jgi:1-acyl-sn-glycerol-3-phosphate acyltransferase
VILFLEGTSTDGHDVLPFRSSLLDPAVRNGWSAAAAAIDYEVSQGRTVADEVCWWGDMMLVPHLWNLANIPRISARLAWSTTMRGTDRKQLAADLRNACVEMRANGSGRRTP